MAEKSPIRRCQTCEGKGTVPQTTTTKRDGKNVQVTKDVTCPAGCNNGVIDIRTI